ncbi:AAA family ATPase [Luteolibacter sp. AS25]|uniref:AAA family ATPase n=1 Tax=Luteolibacter sp. AS25 TaxID=3135776 RepID=UPI00398B48BD
MRLQHVHISDYKNLKDFTLNFDNDSFLDVFVGKNGTGKSNLFEALIEIFRHLYEGLKIPPTFDYKISYTIEETEVLIEWNEGQLRINGDERKTLGKTLLPENVLVYYSGHNQTVTRLIDAYTSAFESRIKLAALDESPRFIGIGSNHKELLLSALLLQPDSSVARKYIEKKLEITSISDSAQVILKRPYFAKSKVIIEEFDPRTHYWGAKGITHDFLLRLQNCVKGEFKHREIYDEKSDTYTLNLDRDLFEKEFKTDTPSVFNHLHNLQILDMLERISIPLTIKDTDQGNVDYFSDGQFQSVYIFAITELFKERHCLTLLDEPDSFLHPEWQHEFLSQIFEISDAATQTNHTLLSSHSASTISSSTDSLISLFEIDGHTVKVSKVPKGEVITSLSAGLITFSESEARLNIQHVLENTSGAVLFTEGITDEIILETAWSKLYPSEERPFEIQNAFDCFFLANLLKRDSLYQEHPNRVFFGVFDFDDGYSSWYRINEDDDLETNPSKCLTKKNKHHEGYGLLLPVPSTSTIKDQVINPINGHTYRHNSLLTIELLFHDVPGLESYFKVDTERTDNFKNFKGRKTRFAKNIVPSLDAEHFKVFEPIFEFIRSKCATPVTANPTN